MERPHDPFIVVFDTDCVLCAGWVQFVLRTERAPVARFVSAWSTEGGALARAHGLSPQDLDRTFLVVAGGRGLTHSAAILAVLGQLRAPWSWGTVLGIVPEAWRDWAYGQVARNRYRWFGRRDRCFLPPEGQAHRFVSAPLQEPAKARDLAS